MKTTRERPAGGFLLAWLRGSIILQMLDRLSELLAQDLLKAFAFMEQKEQFNYSSF